MVDEFPWLTVLWLTPAVGAVVVVVLPARAREAAKWVALGFALVVLVVAVLLAVRFDPGGAHYQFVESHRWIPALGTRYDLGVDGIALVLTLLTAALVPLLLIAGWHDARAQEGPRRLAVHIYAALILLVEAMVLISFFALDVLLFYIFFEAMLIPMYFLIGGFGQGAKASQAAVK
ncbi:MAG TPA: proton-conducting transporter membrane subunit, partial [Aldersonia sp.]